MDPTKTITNEQCPSKKIIKIKRSISGKSFRLIDFQFFDQREENEDHSGSDQDYDRDDTSDPERYPTFKQDQTPKFVVQMFGLNERGETCAIFVDTFQPFFYVKVGEDWTRSTAAALLQHLKSKVGKGVAGSILSAELVEHNKLYSFSGGKTHPFVKITFKNMAAFTRTKNIWYSYLTEQEQAAEKAIDPNSREYRRLTPLQFKGVTLDLYESQIPPLLRYFHIHNISPSGWVFVQTDQARIPEHRSTTCTFEYICTTKQIRALPEKETRVPYKICSFDIEANSSHGDFPIPVKTYKRLSTNILDVFMRMSQVAALDPERAKGLIKRSILTAFGFDQFEHIDLVYPKEPPTKKKVQALIELLLKTPIKRAREANPDEQDNSDVLHIEQIFDSIKAANGIVDANGETGEGKDGDEDGTADAPGTSNPEPEDRYGNQEVEPGTVPFWQKGGAANKKKTLAKTETNYTIIDVLLSEKHDREAKLYFVNETLTLLFPRLMGDKVTFIGSTFSRYGEPEPYLNHCVVLGSCDAIAGAEIETVDSETDLLLAWRDLIQRENPDIMIGYNIFGFDYEFMFRRAQENNCANEFLQLSRKRGEVCIGKGTQGQNGKGKGTQAQTIENTKIVLASGEYDLRYFKMTGRLQVDMMMYFRRDFNLDFYKLDYVAGQFIGDEVKHIIHGERTVCGDCSERGLRSQVTELCSGNLIGLHVGDYIQLKYSGFTADNIRGGHKFQVIAIDQGRIVEHMIKGKMTTAKYNVIVLAGHEHLDTTKTIKWAMAKDDIDHHDIFRLTGGSSADRAIVAKYCIQDCNLVHHLLNKIDVITGYVEMSRICSVPISFLVFRGQGIKLTSYVAKKCREKNTLMPDLEKTASTDGYEGAIVLPPKCSMYMDNPVACVDYASLYPSSMISQNYSHDSKVWTKEYDLAGLLIRETGLRDAQGKYVYDNLPGYTYIDIEFDTYVWRRKTPTSRAEKVVSGKKVCRWAQLPDGQKSIMPAILEELLDARKKTRKQIKTEPDPFMQNILDKRQLGYKVTANSLYGQCGARTSTFFEQDVAASTTATGRQMITYAKRMIEEVYGDRVYETALHGPVKCKAEYVYGDSVANYTPVYVLVNGVMDICTIEDLANKYGGGLWTKCVEEGKQEKEVCELVHVETWTERGWTRLYRVIRHALAPHKKMMRILTHTGLVDVTDDHSLVLENGEEISPKDVKIGTELLHHDLPTIENTCQIFTREQARVMGFFMGDGSCGQYDCPSGKKHSWGLNNASVEIIDKYIELCKTAYPDFEWRMMDTLESSGVYKIAPKSSVYGSIAKFVNMYRSMMYSEKAKVIPEGIINGSEEVRQEFWEGLYDADGDKDKHGYVRIDQKNQISASHICWLASSLGWKTSINTRADKPNIYRITMTKRTQRKNPIAVKRIHDIPYEGYVYDLTTENHHFAAGIGNMIVHNTDSVFFTFNLEDPNTGEKIRGKPALEMTIEIAQDVAGLCTQFLKQPMELTYEKTLMPFILLSKKRYVGMLYETDANKGKLKYMGLSIKRRDSCDYLKDTYGRILNILMGTDIVCRKDIVCKENPTKSTVQLAIEFLNQSLEALVAGNVAMEKLTITKALKSDYKNPMQIGHWVLAERIGERDAGNKPKPGDRMKFVFIENRNKKALMGEKIETPEFVRAQGLKIDYTHYITNQLMKPLQQLFGLALEPIWHSQHKAAAIKSYYKDMTKLQEECPGMEDFMKKKEKYCAAKVKALLFDKILTKIENQRSGNQGIAGFFSL